MKEIFSTIRTRWKSQMPIFFKWVMIIGSGICAVSLAIHMSLQQCGARIPEWWEAVYPYLIGVGAGMMATAKFTQKH